MLLSLSIKNFALIEALEIDFSDNFSIITGETGAGKSILLGAIGLVLGNRADLSSLKNTEQKCVIEAQFLLSNYNLEAFFNENDLDYEPLTIIRREILPSGKSRAFVNDSPVNISVLQDLAEFLIDIHSQHQTRDLLQEDFQIEVLDKVAQNESLLKEYTQKLKALNTTKKELKNAIAEKEDLAKEQEYNQFLLNELVAANLQLDEQESLENELQELSNVELIKENLDKALYLFHDEQVGLSINLNELKTALSKISAFSKNYEEIFQRIQSAQIELSDLAEECQNYSEKVVNDPERLELVSTKLNTIYNLQTKHQVSSVNELIEIQQKLQNKTVLFEELDATILQLQQQKEVITTEIEQIAITLSEARNKVAVQVSEKIQALITQLGMPDAQVAFDISALTDFSKNGKDAVNLLFSANKGMALGNLKKMASGGEMSRIMLSVKSILAEYAKLPTIIFDEIDTGVSGEVALKMGEIMEKMSATMQVFAITHLPQVAARGKQHYKVFKYNQGETTISEIKLLEADERIVEIAEMLSGKNISDSALSHAKALLN